MTSNLPRRGFTAIELLVVVCIVVILLSIFVPYLMRVREDSLRTRCASNLKSVFEALQHYARDNGSMFPRVRSEPSAPWCAFTGADDSDPYVDTSRVQPNDVSASLFQLVRRGYIKDCAVFVCPSTGDRRDEMQDAGGMPVPANVRGNFHDAQSLSYSYASPFASFQEYKLTDTLRPEFALMADLNPGVDSATSDAVPFRSQLPEYERINSPNHRGAGQNVLYAYGAVVWQVTPFCAIDNDNIYTSQASHASTQPQTMPATAVGRLDPLLGPANPDDSLLLPSARDRTRR